MKNILFVIFAASAVFLSGCAKSTLKSAYRKDFLVGVAINRDIATGSVAAADNVNRTRQQVDQDVALVKEQFDQTSPENDLKWALVQPRPGPDGYEFGPADAYVNFGLTNHMYIVGHCLVWHNQTPNWVFAGTNPPPDSSSSGTNAAPARGPGFAGGFGAYRGPRASRDELLQRMHDHIATVVGRYKGQIKVWDVVNEAVNDRGTNLLRNSLWEQIIGPDFIAKAFEYAHEADPDAILRYNDYGLGNSDKRQRFITLIKSLQAQHVPVMAIGTQTHVNVTSPTPEQLDQELTDLETLGLPIHITELDVNGSRSGQRSTSADLAVQTTATQGGMVSNADQRLAEQYSNLFKVFIKHRDHIKLVTFWGANDAVSWLARGHPLLFDGNDQPKPAYYAVMNAATGKKSKTK
ncbi:MAG TPA: endo-1,4-beta-xylanase [Verrucomicrobiae bacterium]|jgi:endo-1,4-beta-xylanase